MENYAIVKSYEKAAFSSDDESEAIIYNIALGECEISVEVLLLW